jgi:beta-xylosidase
MKTPLLHILLIGCLLCSLAPAQTTRPTTSPGPYLFASFRGNGEDGLHLASSPDGYTWQALNNDKSYLKPLLGKKEKLMRDPCIAQGPDGTFHMVWTTGWHERSIGYANSKDLTHWSDQLDIPVMEDEPTAQNAWAPELFYDDAKQQWIIFWATTLPGRFPESEKAGDAGLNHRIYAVTTKDFKTFSPRQLLFNPGFSVIDATLAKAGDKYVMFVKDETKTPVKKFIFIATAESPEGPWTPSSDAITPDWCEGPSPLRVGDHWLVYFDHYTNPHYYGAVRSKDLKTWENVSDQIHFPPGTRHGTAFKISEDQLRQLTPNAN